MGKVSLKQLLPLPRAHPAPALLGKHALAPSALANLKCSLLYSVQNYFQNQV